MRRTTEGRRHSTEERVVEESTGEHAEPSYRSREMALPQPHDRARRRPRRPPHATRTSVRECSGSMRWVSEPVEGGMRGRSSGRTKKNAGESGWSQLAGGWRARARSTACDGERTLVRVLRHGIRVPKRRFDESNRGRPTNSTSKTATYRSATRWRLLPRTGVRTPCRRVDSDRARAKGG